MYKVISVLGSVLFLGIYLIWNQQAWTSQVDDLKLENQRLIEEIEILKVCPKSPASLVSAAASAKFGQCPWMSTRHGNKFLF